MRDDLDEALCRDFPNTFRDRHGRSEVTSMCWGFPGDGWEPLIRRAAAKIEAALLKLPPRLRAKLTSSQVKEKFGTLRWHMTQSRHVVAEIDRAIDEAEQQSVVTCEGCGAPGTLKSSGGRQATLCGACRRRGRR
jgi:hypothetical protein